MFNSVYIKIFFEQITTVIPSITSIVFEGITLICHNNKVNTDNKKFIEDFFNNISFVKIIKEIFKDTLSR